MFFTIWFLILNKLTECSMNLQHKLLYDMFSFHSMPSGSSSIIQIYGTNHLQLKDLCFSFKAEFRCPSIKGTTQSKSLNVDWSGCLW